MSIEYAFTVCAYESDMEFLVTSDDSGWFWVLYNTSEINSKEYSEGFSTSFEAQQDAIEYAAGERSRIEAAEDEERAWQDEQNHRAAMQRWYQSTRL